MIRMVIHGRVDPRYSADDQGKKVREMRKFMERSGFVIDYYSERTDVYRDSQITVDYGARLAYVRGSRARLSPAGFKLLSAFVSNPGRTLTISYLADSIRGMNKGNIDGLRWHIWGLRREIEENPGKPVLIRTIHGFGYRYSKPAED